MATVAVSSKSISGFDPRSAIPGCQLWLDAADSSTFTFSSGSNLSQWNDKSGNNNHVYTTVGTPSNITDSGYSVVSFPSGGAVMQSSNSITISSNVTTVYGVCKSAGGYLFAFTDAPNSGGGDYSIRYNAGQPVTIVNGDANDMLLNQLYINGIFLTSVAGTANVGSNYHIVDGAVTSNLTSRFSVSSSFYSRYFSGNVCEIIVITSAVTTAQRQQLEGYLAAKWGLQSQLNKYFSPTSIPTCSLWLDAADPSTISYFSGTGYISQWNDKSGYGGTLSTNYGYYSGYGLLNNLPSILTGSPDQTGRLTGNFGSVSASSNYTIFIAWNFNSASGGNARLCGFTPNSGYKEDYIDGFEFDPNSTNSPVVFGYGGNVSSATISPNSFTSNTGPVVQTINVTCSKTLTLSYWGFGTRPVAGGTANGNTIGANWFEMLVYNSALTTAQQTQIQGYLGKKWGISTTNAVLPTTHPYYSVKPFTRIFQPTDIAGCQLWFDAADSSTITLSGSNVSQWNDKSGSGFSLVKSGSYALPTFTNGGVYFNNATLTQTITNPVNFFQYGQSGTTFIVANIIAPSANSNSFILYFQSRSSSYYLVFSSTDNSNNTYIIFNNTGGNPTASASFKYSGTTNIIVTSRNLGTCYISYNGTSQTVSQSGNTYGIDYINSINIGNGPTSFGTVYEIIHYNTYLTSSQQQQIEGYLAWKWGLNGQLTNFSPTTISGCKLWLDAADTSSFVLSSSNLTSITDKSGNTTPTITSTFSYTSNAVNGNGVIYNNGGYITGTFPTPFSASVHTSFIVMNMTSAPADGTAAFRYGESSNYSVRVMDYAFSTFREVFWNPGSYTATTPTITSSYFIWTSYVTSNSIGVRLNGSGDATTSIPTVSATINSYAIGYNIDSSSVQNFPGNIGEIITYNTALSRQQIQQVETYLSRKWGIATSNFLPPFHPYRALPPTNATNGTTNILKFSYTGSSQSFTVPGGISTLYVYMWGAGGGGSYSGGYSDGGYGALIYGKLTVTSGTVLTLVVGGGGSGINGASSSTYGGGGVGNGGYSSVYGGSGGGRSSISFGGYEQLVAGGGGGGAISAGGNGGETLSGTTFTGGVKGSNISAATSTGNGSAAPGSGSGGGVSGGGGSNGSSDRGGDGYASNTQACGGGGGGYYGGAGGGLYGDGGGGGTSFYSSAFTLSNYAYGKAVISQYIPEILPYYKSYSPLPGNAGVHSTTSSTAGGNGLIIIFY